MFYSAGPYGTIRQPHLTRIKSGEVILRKQKVECTWKAEISEAEFMRQVKRARLFSDLTQASNRKSFITLGPRHGGS